MGDHHRVARNTRSTIATRSWIVVLEAPVTDDTVAVDANKGKVGPAATRVAVDDNQTKAVEIAPIFDNESYTLEQLRGTHRARHKIVGNIVPKHMTFTTPGPPSTSVQNPDDREVKTKLDALAAPKTTSQILRQDATDFGKVELIGLEDPK